MVTEQSNIYSQILYIIKINLIQPSVQKASSLKEIRTHLFLLTQILTSVSVLIFFQQRYMHFYIWSGRSIYMHMYFTFFDNHY